MKVRYLAAVAAVMTFALATPRSAQGTEHPGLVDGYAACLRGPGAVLHRHGGVEHWHGATSVNAMSHIAIQEAVDGRVVEWLEKVSDDEYEGG